MRVLKIILEVAFWIVAASAVLFGGVLLIALGIAPALGVFAIFIMVMMLPVAMRIFTNARERRSATLLSYIEQTVRLNLPLNRMLFAAQRSEPRKTALRLAHLRQRLEDGMPIGTALELSAPEVPERTVSIIAAAERLGRLPQAMSRIIEQQAIRLREDATSSAFLRLYPTIMLAITAGIMGLISVFVLPKYEQIFKDFGMKLPAITVNTFHAGYALAPVLLMLMVVVLLWTAARTLWEVFHPLALRQTTLGLAADHMLWWMPISHGLQRDRGLADVFELLGDAMEAGTSANRALAEAAHLRINAVLRGRIGRWALSVASGHSLHDTARAAGMPAIIVGMLASAHSGDDAAAVFRFLARYYGSRFSRTAILLRGAAVPIMVLIFGVIVATVALSLVVPLAQLVNYMS